jgi:hypothetical protein
MDESEQLNETRFTGMSVFANGGDCRLIRPAKVGARHFRNGNIYITAWKVFEKTFQNQEFESTRLPMAQIDISSPRTAVTPSRQPIPLM